MSDLIYKVGFLPSISCGTGFQLVGAIDLAGLAVTIYPNVVLLRICFQDLIIDILRNSRFLKHGTQVSWWLRGAANCLDIDCCIHCLDLLWI